MRPVFGSLPPERRQRRRREDPNQLSLFTANGSARPHLQLILGSLRDDEREPEPVEAAVREAAA